VDMWATQSVVQAAVGPVGNPKGYPSSPQLRHIHSWKYWKFMSWGDPHHFALGYPIMSHRVFALNTFLRSALW